MACVWPADMSYEFSDNVVPDIEKKHLVSKLCHHMNFTAYFWSTETKFVLFGESDIGAGCATPINCLCLRARKHEHWIFLKHHPQKALKVIKCSKNFCRYCSQQQSHILLRYPAIPFFFPCAILDSELWTPSFSIPFWPNFFFAIYDDSRAKRDSEIG